MKLIRSRSEKKISGKTDKETKTVPLTGELPDSEKHQYLPDESKQKTWKILIVDDEPDIHKITRIVMKGFLFDGRSLELISAYSAEQACEILENDPNFAAAMIDVVMETEAAGLELVNRIRKEMGLLNIRLIIRTGQPGKAPERFVIDHYDIDDYREKTDLTNLKMYTMFRSAVKSYRDILTIEKSRGALEQMVKERTRQLSETNKKLEQSLFGLEKALQEVKQLSGLLPICSYCKKVRDDKGYWNQIEKYISERSDAEFSHSVCEECVKKYYPELDL